MNLSKNLKVAFFLANGFSFQCNEKGRRRGRGGEETLEEAAQGKREDLEKHNKNQRSLSIGGDLSISFSSISQLLYIKL